MKVSELTGAMLNYWVARAEGIPASQLKIIQVPRTENQIVVWQKPGQGHIAYRETVLAYSTDWAQGGPLIEKHIETLYENGDHWGARTHSRAIGAIGATPLQAICRAVVRAAFGDEVPNE
jgi:hypothetical protein